ncbi:DUF4429 domain-containing protein [Nocardiopsis sp. HNM0947]|uniref:DUF4429 domain-containing protein n=1 Tax=Nocardiopsis coralli TaxID=2772213 RepID=A0ABR9PDJ1_9ACTN|nr:DUF4429 domain-containing protein [Nocardiopsis coralli]MBE3001905.1 DUF4429 domain-containing protein [Nocardiopsis coralli]
MEELRGRHGTWRLGPDEVRLSFSGRRVPALLKALGSCSVPLGAIAGVDFDRGDRKHGWRMRLRLVEGADPYAGLGAAESEDLTPLLLTGPHDQELLAEYFADQIASSARMERETSGSPASVDVARSLVARVPFRARTGEGRADFDGNRVRLTWDGFFASTAKGTEEHRDYALAEIERATWHPPVDISEGWLRIVLRGVTIAEATDISHDFFTLATHGAKGSEEAFLMAATVNAHLAGGGGGAVAAGPGPEQIEAAPAGGGNGGNGGGGEEIFAKIRELGRLRDEGLVTDEEFAAKKTELLARL